MFARLERLDDGVSGGVIMFGGVFIGGAIAATDMSARQADAQMYPVCADFKAVFAALGAGCHGVNLYHVGAGFKISSHIDFRPVFIFNYFPRSVPALTMPGQSGRCRRGMSFPVQHEHGKNRGAVA